MVERAIQPVVGTSVFEMNVSTIFKMNVRNEDVQKFVSVSDEAFARLVLIAYHDSMREEIRRRQENIATRYPLPPGLYTSRGTASSLRNSGWSRPGVELYKELVQEVMSDHASNSKVDEEYRKDSRGVSNPRKRQRVEDTLEMYEGDLSNDDAENEPAPNVEPRNVTRI